MGIVRILLLSYCPFVFMYTTVVLVRLVFTYTRICSRQDQHVRYDERVACRLAQLYVIHTFF